MSHYFPWICLAGMICFGLWALLDLWRLSAPERRQKREKRVSAQRLMELLTLNREIPQLIKTVCAFCGQFMHGDEKAELVSHGCCYRCRDINFGQARPTTKLADPESLQDRANSNTALNSKSASVPPLFNHVTI